MLGRTRPTRTPQKEIWAFNLTLEAITKHEELLPSYLVEYILLSPASGPLIPAPPWHITWKAHGQSFSTGHLVNHTIQWVKQCYSSDPSGWRLSLRSMHFTILNIWIFLSVFFVAIHAAPSKRYVAARTIEPECPGPYYPKSRGRRVQAGLGCIPQPTDT